MWCQGRLTCTWSPSASPLRMVPGPEEGGVCVCRAAENQLELHKGKKNKIKATRTCKARHNIPHCYHCDSFPTTHLFRSLWWDLHKSDVFKVLQQYQNSKSKMAAVRASSWSILFSVALFVFVSAGEILADKNQMMFPWCLQKMAYILTIFP